MLEAAAREEGEAEIEEEDKEEEMKYNERR